MTESSFIQESKLNEIVAGYDNVALKRDDDISKIYTQTATKVENSNDSNHGANFLQKISHLQLKHSMVSYK